MESDEQVVVSMHRLVLTLCYGSPMASADINGDRRKALTVTTGKLSRNKMTTRSIGVHVRKHAN